MNHSTKGAETVNAIDNLALITGNIGRAGASPFSITGQCNAMGTREAGFASSLPGYRKFESAEHRRNNWPACGGSTWIVFRFPEGWPIPTSSREPRQEDSCTLGDRYESDRFVSRISTCLTPGLESWSFWWCRTDFIPLRLRSCASRLSRRDLGREGRDVYELGKARQQGESCGRSAG